MVPGYHLSATGHVAKDNPCTSECVEGCDLLEVKVIEGAKHFWVTPLDKQLEYPSADRIWNFDEKPLFPDSPRLSTVGTAPVAAGRSAIWTVGMFHLFPLFAHNERNCYFTFNDYYLPLQVCGSQLLASWAIHK
jgi:hypothetical protein